MASLIGKEIGKYRITERIGRGGMADVYLGIHTHLDRKVAIKVLHSHLLEGGDFVARFKREAKAVANLRHPNIVQVYDFDVTDEMIFMVMEFIDGTSLHSRLVEVGNRGERLPIKLIGSIINDIAGALDYAHSKGMLHRDIKPSNILLDQNDKAYLTDFGIAKLLDDQKFTATGTLVGTPAYMSPEQGMGEDLTEESDIYSLGIVAFEMLTGQVPYDAKTPIGIVHKQINDPVPELSKLVDGVPGTAQEVLNRALAKSPEGRYNRAEDLVKALRVALQALDSTEPIVKQAAAQVEEILDAPTVTMEKQDLEKATVVMESEKPAKEPEKKPEPKEKAPKKKVPTWAFIAGGVALLAVVGLIITQVLGVGLYGGDTPSDLPEGAVQVRAQAKREGEGITILGVTGDGDYNLVQIGRDWAW
ncbi:MAG: serine/threonine-protein kinase, partial [Anaerolineales bacterium]